MQSSGASALASLVSARPAAGQALGLGQSAEGGALSASPGVSDFAETLAAFMGLALGVDPSQAPSAAAASSIEHTTIGAGHTTQSHAGQSKAHAIVQAVTTAAPALVPAPTADGATGDPTASPAPQPMETPSVAAAGEPSPAPGQTVRLLATAQGLSHKPAIESAAASAPAPASTPADPNAPTARAIEVLTTRNAPAIAAAPASAPSPASAPTPAPLEAAAPTPLPAPPTATVVSADAPLPASAPLPVDLAEAPSAAAIAAAANQVEPAPTPRAREAGATATAKKGEVATKSAAGLHAAIATGGNTNPAASKAVLAPPFDGEATLDAEPAPISAPLARDTAATPQARDFAPGLQSQTVVHGPAPHAGPATAPQTVAHLAAQIIQKTDGKTSRFDVQLDPAGLGKVDVQIEINARGQLSAALSFDNPQAAAELRSRAGELTRALEQAGFDLAKGSLSFNLGSQGGGHQLAEQHNGANPTWRGRAFADVTEAADLPPGLRNRTALPGRIDVTV